MNTLISRSLRGLGALAVAMAGVASLVASGGGSGGSSSEPFVQITADNAFEVASGVVQAVGVTFDLGKSTGDVVSPQAAPVGAGFLLQRLLVLPPSVRIQAMSVAPLAAFGPETVPCEVPPGSVTLSGNVADPTTLSVGDRITATFSDCDDNQGFVLDGQLALVVRAVQGDPLTDVYLLTLDLTATSLGVVEDNQTYGADGDFTLTLDSLDFPSLAIRMAGSRLELTEGAQAFTLIDFDHTLEASGAVAPQDIVAQAIGTFVSDAAGGRVDYETEPGNPVLATGDDDPHAGVIQITGAGNSTIHVVIIDSTSVQLDIDKGDGTPHTFEDTSWPELNGQTPPL